MIRSWEEEYKKRSYGETHQYHQNYIIINTRIEGTVKELPAL
jgi:hypothetical protein